MFVYFSPHKVFENEKAKDVWLTGSVDSVYI